MTINDYLQNPYGKGSAFSNITSQKEKLEQEYAQYSNKFISKIYKFHNNLIFHVIVPSVKKDYITYDVILEMETNGTTDYDANNLEFKCFSNCPSFIFTYANAFRQKGLLCKWLENKYKKEVKKNVANVKNQYGIIGLERSLYLACLYLKKSMRTRNEVINTVSNKASSYTSIANTVRSQDEIMEKYKIKLTSEEAKSVSGIKDINFTSNRKESTRKNTDGYTKTSNSTLFTSRTNKQAKTKKSGTTKKTRRF